MAGCIAAVAATAAPGAAQSASTSASSYVTSLRPNVVTVTAGAKAGFGFIVGLDPEGLLIATAEHTLRQPDVPTPEICFLDRPPPCPTGTVTYVADPLTPGDPDLDLAFVRVAYPEDLRWRPDAAGPAPEAGEPVWFIGRTGDWYVPGAPGRIVPGHDSARHLSYEGLPVAGGVSGAPILTSLGIVAMHLQSEGDEGTSTGLRIDAIRRHLVERAGGRWLLVPRADCSDAADHRSRLESLPMTVHFLWHRPEAALEAMARLSCLGVRVTPRPVRNGQDWPGSRIAYRSGGLRLARTLQTVLRAHGPLDTALGDPPGSAALWIE